VSQASTGGAVAGVTVLDLTQQLPGPYATLLLAGLGARVIKIEPPGGDLGRQIDPPMFRKVNAGKESVVLDLKTGSGRDRLLGLARWADVFVEGFRPGVTTRLGADHAAISALRPDVIYCSISGFGAAGPYAGIPGHDLNYLGVGGAVDEPPLNDEASATRQIGMPVVDMATGTMGALAIVAALSERTATGTGAFLDLGMLDTAVYWGDIKAPLRDGGAEGAYGVVAAADGGLLSVAVMEDKFWRSLCEALGWSEWHEDPAFATYGARRLRAAEIHARLAATIATRPRDEWLERLWAADVPVAPVHDRAAAMEDPQIVARRLFADNGVGGRDPVVPLPSALRTPLGHAPRLGADTERVLAELDEHLDTDG
jgi:crotonobetainyl-CoA:carnitine CoA-transferase CaiB-like acyl-CoA transferase